MRTLCKSSGSQVEWSYSVQSTDRYCPQHQSVLSSDVKNPNDVKATDRVMQYPGERLDFFFMLHFKKVRAIMTPTYPLLEAYEKVIVTFANHLISHARHMLAQIAKDTELEKGVVEAIAPQVIVKNFDEGDPSATTPSKAEVWLQKRLYDRAILFDAPRERPAARARPDQVQEGKLLKFYLAFALAHEMAHVMVRQKLPDDQQRKANTSPAKYNIGYGQYQKPESGWCLERFAFGGVLVSLRDKHVPWASDQKTKVIGLMLDTTEGMHLLDIYQIIQMWNQRCFTSFKACLAVRNYKPTRNEIAKKESAHVDTVGAKEKLFTPYQLKPNEYVKRMKYGDCYVFHEN